MLKHPFHHWIDKNGRVLDTLTLVHVVKGTGTFRSEPSGKFLAKAGDVFFAYPGVRHWYGFVPKTGWDDEWLEIEAEGALSILSEAGVSPEMPVLRQCSSRVVSAAFQSLFDLSMAESDVGLLAAGAYRVLASVLSSHAVSDKSGSSCPFRSVRSQVQERLERAEELLLATAMPVTEVATTVGFSSLPLFSRRFKAHYGVSPQAFRMGKRFGG